MKNVFFIIILITLISVIFIGHTFYDASRHQTSFSRSLELNSNFTKQLLKNFYSDDPKLKKKAEKSIKSFVLEDLNYTNWLDYSDYIEMEIYPIDITNNLSNELIIVLNLSKDEGVIGIYKNYEDKYIYKNSIENLTHINDVTSLKDPQTDRIFLIIDEIIDESFGAYFTDNFFRIFTILEGSYKEVYRQSEDYEAFYYEKWSDPSIENPKWYKLTEKSVIDSMITDTGKVILKNSKTIAKLQSPTTEDESIPENFSLVSEKNFNITSLWNENFKHFIQGVGKLNSSNEVVGIIENSYQTADALLNSKDKYYKVITKGGKIKYVTQSDLNILKDYSNEY